MKVFFREAFKSEEGKLHSCYKMIVCNRQAVTAGLHPGAMYQKVALVRLVGMLLIVYIQTQHLAYVRNVAIETVGTGIMGKMVRSTVYCNSF